ncbi:hypothetical protein L3Q67_33955 [Saccharothrix sp. AJ9571]|nr:hypothetical protein L3Q67_33955 [Saccharothrix sp. AJ9571]
MRAGTLRKLGAALGALAAAAAMSLTGATTASATDVGTLDSRGCAFTSGPLLAHELCINVAGVGSHVDRAQGVFTGPPMIYCDITFKLFGVDTGGRHWENEQRAGCGPAPYVDWYFGPGNGFFKPNSLLCVGVSTAAGRPYNGDYACITIRA